MDVKLYVYDLSRGMARAMSKQFLGIQIDAIYHTSIVWNGVETFFGQGIQQSVPGGTHHGQPMEVVDLGQTQLPAEVVLEYIESMKSIYTAAGYDLFENNCNNFSNDLAQFLVGKGIPDHITSLPKQVLETPFGQMLRPQLDASMRSITQAPVPPPNAAGSLNGSNGSTATPNGATPQIAKETTASAVGEYGSVYNVTEPSRLDSLLAQTKSSAATLFFTSATCAPCRLAYPTFDSLAAENPRALFVKIDISIARELAARYSIRATPTFMTFAKGTKIEQWSGASPPQLRANVAKVINQVFPPHRHTSLDVPTLRLGSLRAVTYTKIPPLDKLLLKLGPEAKSPAVVSMRSFVAARQAAASDPSSVALPDMQTWAAFLSSAPTAVPVDGLFALLDLLRCAVLDPRVSGWFAADAPNAITNLQSFVANHDSAPYPLRLVTLQLTATLFSTPLWVPRLLSSPSVLSLCTSALLASSSPAALRGAAASLAFNLAAANYRSRREEPGKPEPLPTEVQVELLAALAELFSNEPEAGKAEGGHAALATMGLLVYFCEEGGEVDDLCSALGVKVTIERVKADGQAEKARKDLVAVLP